MKGMQGRRLRRTALIVCVMASVFAAMIAGAGCIMYAYLAATVNARQLVPYVFYGVTAYTVLTSLSVIPSIALRLLKVRAVAAYVSAGAAAGILSTYWWWFAFAIDQSLWGWVHVVTASDGSGYDRTPPFLDVISAAYAYLPRIFALHIIHPWPAAALDASLGALSGILFWLAFVWWPARKARPRAQQ